MRFIKAASQETNVTEKQPSCNPFSCPHSHKPLTIITVFQYVNNAVRPQQYEEQQIYSYSTTNKMHLLSQFIHSCKMLYVFWTVFPSIIRSSKLHIQQRYMSNSCCYLLLSGMRWNCSSVSSPIAAAAV